MFTTNRCSLIIGAVAIVSSSFLQRGHAQPASGSYRLDPLPYPVGKNEPYIDALTMEIYHDRHHAAYVNKLNGIAAQQPNLLDHPLHELLARLDSVPEAVRTTVRNNGAWHARIPA